MVIEFIGLPGAGKTTLCQQVAEILSKHDIAVRQTSYGSARRSSKMGRTLSKSCHFLGAFILNHKHTILSAADIARTKQKSPIDYLKVTFNWIIASFFVQRNHCALEITLMDQGVFQALWSIGFSAQDEAWASTMSGRVSLMSIPDIVVVVEASPRTIEGRLRAHRSHISRLEAELQTGSALWARSISLLETVKMIMSLQQVAVMVIDTETPEPLNATATSVAEGIDVEVSSQRLLEVVGSASNAPQVRALGWIASIRPLLPHGALARGCRERRTPRLPNALDPNNVLQPDTAPNFATLSRA